MSLVKTSVFAISSLLISFILLSCNLNSDGEGVGGGYTNGLPANTVIVTENLGIYSETVPPTLTFYPAAGYKAIYASWGTTLPTTNESSSGNTSGDGTKYMNASFANLAAGSGITYTIQPENPGTNLTRFYNGALVFSLNIPAAQPDIVVAIEQDVYGQASYRTAQITLSSGNKYGFVKDGNWHTVIIPIVDFLSVAKDGSGTAATMDLSKMAALFQLRAPNNTAISGVKFDNVYWKSTTEGTTGSEWGPGTNYNQVPVWTDEFNGSSLDASKWKYDTGAMGYGNVEVQNYTSAAANSYFQNGSLIIKAIDTGVGALSAAGRYTSARITTRGLYSFTYGKVAARIKMDVAGQGAWPAFWLLGNSGTYQADGSIGGWPACGEIDIMEWGLAGTFNYIGGTVHYGTWPNHFYTGSSASSSTFATDYHVFEVEKKADILIWRMDGITYFAKSTGELTGSNFDQPFYIILNLAIGGNGTPYTGKKDPDPSAFPKYMYIDWVRIYQ